MFQDAEQGSQRTQGAQQSNPPQANTSSVPAFDAHLQNQAHYASSNVTQTPSNDWNQPPAYVSRNPYARNQQSGGQKIKLAVISLITGVLGFPFVSAFLAGILAAILGMVFGTPGAIFGLVVVLAFIPTSLITGIVALVKAKRYPEEFGGKGIAIAGIVVSSLSILIFPVIAAIAIPNLLAARRSANEGSAIASIRTIHDAEMTYQATTGAGNYGELSLLSQSQLIDSSLASGQKSGYKFVITKTDASSFEPAGFKISAVPMVSTGVSSTGARSFYIDEAGVIHAASKSGLPADKADPVLETSNQIVEADSTKYVPSLVGAKGSANEASAISTLKVLHGAEITYQATKGAGNFGELTQLSQSQLISADLGSGQKSGYKFVLSKKDASSNVPATFNVTAVPLVSTGGRSFYIDEMGVIHAAKKSGLPADKTDPTLND